MLRYKIGDVNDGILETLSTQERAHYMGEYLVAIDSVEMLCLLQAFGLLSDGAPYVLTERNLVTVSEDVQVFFVEAII